MEHKKERTGIVDRKRSDCCRQALVRSCLGGDNRGKTNWRWAAAGCRRKNCCSGSSRAHNHPNRKENKVTKGGVAFRDEWVWDGSMFTNREKGGGKRWTSVPRPSTPLPRGSRTFFGRSVTHCPGNAEGGRKNVAQKWGHYRKSHYRKMLRG